MTRRQKIEDQRKRLVALAERCGVDRFSYTGAMDRLGLTYRAPDLAVVWSGDGTFVVVPHKGPIATKDLLKDRSGLEDLIETMCTDGDSICEMVGDTYRRQFGPLAA